MPLTPQESSKLEFVNILKSKHARYIDGVRVIDADAVADDYVPPGAAIGKITGSGQYGPVTRDYIAAAGANAGTNTIPLKNLNETDWHNWQVGDSLAIKSMNDAVAATATTGVEGDNNALTWTAQDAGSAGNGITVALEDPEGTSQDLSIAVNYNDITVSLSTNGTDAIDSTAADIITAIEADADASALVAVDNTGDSTGAGVVTAESADLTEGADAGSELELEETATIASIDESSNELTVDSITSAYAEDTVVEKNDGSSTAEFVCTELADVSDEDALVGGILHGAVYSDRMPNYDSIVATDLSMISFE